MSLCYREQRRLRTIEARLLRSDSHLAAMLDVFGKLYSGQGMPASEQVPSRQDIDRRAFTRIAAAFAVVALAISVMFSAALAVAAASQPARVRPSAPQPERTGPGRESGSKRNPPG